MSNSNKEQFSEETERIWDKMTIFKERYKEYSNKVKSLEEALTVVNLELSLTKNENARLKEELKMKQTSITKYQQMLKELVDVEDRYCKLIQEKKNSDRELAAAKKLHLDLEKRHEEEKKEIQNALQEELRILKDDSAMKEEVTIVEYSQKIEAQNKEIVSLQQILSECVKKYEEQISNIRKDSKNAQNEIDDLKNSKELQTGNDDESPHKESKIVSVAGNKQFHLRDSVSKIDKGELNCSTRNQEENPDPTPNKCLSISKRSQAPPNPMPASCVYPLSLRSPRHWPPSSASLLSESTRSTVPDSQQSSRDKKGMTSLEVFRLPTRSCKKSPVRKKRKLYSRSDDTL